MPIITSQIPECKNWRVNIPKEVVHAFRTVVQEAGANRGYVISRVGFQHGAGEAAKSTNIELVTFAEFQSVYFPKWWKKRLLDMEKDLYLQLKDDAARAAYDKVGCFCVRMVEAHGTATSL
jgi:hypothetical protein